MTRPVARAARRGTRLAARRGTQLGTRRGGRATDARTRPLTALLLALLLTLLGSSPAAAHDARPLSITIVEQADGVYRTVVRAPPTVDNGNAPEVFWPASCELIETGPLVRAIGSTSLVSCAGGLENRTIRLAYPLYNPSLTTLFRFESAKAPAVTAVAPPDQLEWLVPPEPTLLGVARDYLVLGFRHIWEGPDHLLFVAGLMLLARRTRRIVWAVTGFTAAHSITLSLAALGLVAVPIEPVEAMIALSILFLAAEVARRDSTSFSRRFPVALSFVFGLLHGFGFASALAEIGLPRSELAAGLLFFNLGVELGQLAFIGAAAILILVVQTARSSARPTRTQAWLTADRGVLLGAYALGIPAAFWCLERTAAAFGA